MRETSKRKGDKIMNIRKELFEEINNVAQENLERAQGMIDILNMMSTTRFILIKKRVCYETIENGIKKFHDAYVYTK